MREQASLRHSRRARGVDIVDGVMDADRVGDGLGLGAVRAALHLVVEEHGSLEGRLHTPLQLRTVAAVEELKLLFGVGHHLVAYLHHS